MTVAYIFYVFFRIVSAFFNKFLIHFITEILGSPVKLPSARFVSALRVCCNRDVILNQGNRGLFIILFPIIMFPEVLILSVFVETAQHVSKVVTWKRSVSSLSSSSKSALMTSIIKDDVDDSNSDFVEEFAMVSGSHSSTLDRLHAWERKLYDEIKVYHK
jgi:hypothetical protein